jgi:vitamin B12 transporter
MVLSTARSKPKSRVDLTVLSAAALQLAALAPAVQAQGAAADSLPGVTIVGSRLPITPSGLAQNVTIIDAKEIQALNPGRLEDILSQISGVYVDSVGKAGGFSSLYMRGGENSHLLVMIDGVKVNDSTTTRGSAYDLSSIDVNQIERIEILRGPNSAIYGGEALSGVMNIITRRRTGTGVQGSVYGGLGQENYARAGGAVSIGNDALQGQLSLGTMHDGNSSDDAYLRLNTFSGSLRFAPINQFDGEVFGYHSERKSAAFPDDSGGPRLAVNREKTIRDGHDTTYGVHLGWGELQSLRIQGHASVYERKEKADNAAIDAGVRFPVPQFTSDSDFKRTSFQLTAAHNWSATTSLVVGVERQNEKGNLTSVGIFGFGGNPDVLPFALDRGTNSIFAEGRFEVVPAVEAQLGIRHDKVEGLSGETTPHLGLVWTAAAATTLKASYSEGFKPPSFFALGFPIGANPDLKPERSKNIELTLVQKLGTDGSSAQVSVYQIDYKDLVDFDATTFTNVNRGKIVVKGIEPSLNLRIGSAVRAQVTATLLDISEQDGLPPLRNRPERRATAYIVYDATERSSLHAAFNATSNFLDRSNPTGDIEMPGFATVDVGYTLRWQQFQLTLSVDNLFNKYYEQFVGFPGQDRRFRIEVRGDF